ncbi:MAG: dienelactone hydrolase family protein [Actinobacteria bacterium]|nr:dienelactone hydrolase family protein [Actinomycetota bacterium]MCB9389015.1 dienelactone hydrolase family protein [Acidimicrobiia bacterium]
MQSVMDAFDHTRFTAEGRTHDVFRQGSGPRIIVIHEVPGITPNVARFANMLVEEGFEVVLPSLLGQPGRRVDPLYSARSLASMCISAEFSAFAWGRSTPAVDWLKALSASLYAERAEPLGVVGMCFSGGYGLAMLTEPHVVAPVLSQPSLPAGVLPAQQRGFPLSDADAAAVAQRVEGEDLEVMGLRFTGDPLCRRPRFDALRRLLGDRFIGIEIDSSPGNPEGIGRLAHSVLTEELAVDDPGHPTMEAYRQVVNFLHRHLTTR